MQPHDFTHHALDTVSPRFDAGALLSSSIHAHPRYERAALANAFEDGLMPDEVLQILAGRRVAEAFPVRWGESLEAYASRAVAEMFVSYLQ